jgi:hypothetical protein
MHFTSAARAFIACSSLLVLLLISKRPDQLIPVNGSRNPGRATNVSSLEADLRASLSRAQPLREPGYNTGIVRSYGRLPLDFEVNRGQADKSVQYLARASAYDLLLSDQDTSLLLTQRASNDGHRLSPTPVEVIQHTFHALNWDATPRIPSSKAQLRLRFVGSNQASALEGIDQLAARSNYFIGNDPRRWIRDVPHYAKIRRQNIYPGIDIVYYGKANRLEFDFVVSRMADPAVIALKVEGADDLGINGLGDLAIRIGGQCVTLTKPLVYQTRDDGLERVTGKYRRRDDGLIGFDIGDYDLSLPLVIDPTLVYSSYLGGDQRTNGYAIAVDTLGNAYVTGDSGRVGQDSSLTDVFVKKIDPTGSMLLYSVYIGGNQRDIGYGIAVDSGGSVYLAGSTTSDDFPAVNPIQSKPQSHTCGFPGYTTYCVHGFVARLNVTGNSLLYSTYLGGNNFDEVHGVALDTTGNAYVTGWTNSTTFPTVNALQQYSGGGSDAFVAKLDPTGATLLFSTYLGGTQREGEFQTSCGIAVDSFGSVYVTGTTSSLDFPTMRALQPVYGGGGDAYVSKLDTNGAMMYSTYLGGTNLDSGHAIVVNHAGEAFVTGTTYSTDFPTTPHVFQPTLAPTLDPILSNNDAFVTKVNASGDSLAYSTYLGGQHQEVGYALAVDLSGNVCVTGYTSSINFPVVSPFKSSVGGTYNSNAFVTKLNGGGSELIYSTCLGGQTFDTSFGIALGPFGNAYVTGTALSNDFPVTKSILAFNLPGAFIAKLEDSSPPFVDITMSRSSYAVGEDVTATAIQISNPSLNPRKIRLELWLSVPGLGALTLLDLGSDGSLVLPTALSANAGPLSLFRVTSTFPPKGDWQFNSRITEATNGGFVSSDINAFTIK